MKNEWFKQSSKRAGRTPDTSPSTASPSRNTKVGEDGEDFVVHYLEKAGYHILARNISWRGGEIDIIAQREETVCFIEVKTRHTTYFSLSTVVTPTKQQKIIATARRYISSASLRDVIIQFDIALVERCKDEWYITYLPNAFTAPSENN